MPGGEPEIEFKLAALAEGIGGQKGKLAIMSEEMSEENLPPLPGRKAVNQGWGNQKRVLAGCLTKNAGPTFPFNCGLSYLELRF
ncbi:hypothetical protein [Serratia fonticola]|uniref:hypothetical protein n=1 Tax=Serratia fonticola TaxID=47917 RepID=UPI001377DE46|nr:hypothetical protein [Serratia fonticola]MBC3217995.1 hypothetical protein [Serratia fonticola]NCG51047.1 hypothetical protein [Serratia fonticola]